MSNRYSISFQPQFTHLSFGLVCLRDAPSEERKRSIDFHVRSNDYFGTIATVLGLIGDSLQRNEQIAQKNLENLKDELVYLQERYNIQRKE